jgi:hypothetical protein
MAIPTAYMLNGTKSLLLILLLVFISCEHDRIEILNPASVSYFPMQLGNKWIYESDNLDLTIEIISIKIHHAYAYYEFLKTYDGEMDTMFCKAMADEKVFIFFDGNDELLIDFQSPEGETWQSYGNFIAKVNRIGLNVQTPAGNFENVIEIFSDNTQSSDLYEFNKYAPGVGLVETIGFRRALRLKNAYVNGITYP